MTLQKWKFNIKIWKVRKPSVWNAAKHSINRTISYQDDPVQCTFILSREGSWWKPKFKVYSSNLEDEKNPQWLLRRIIRLGLEFGVYYEFGLPRDLRSPKQPRTFTSEIYMEGGLKWPLYCPQGSGTLRQQYTLLYSVILCFTLLFSALLCLTLLYTALHCSTLL